MKTLLLVLPLAFATPSCSTLDALLDVPAAAVDDVGGAVDAITPGEQAVIDTTGTTVQTGTTLLTGNAALGAAAGSLATLLAGMFFKRRKKSK